MHPSEPKSHSPLYRVASQTEMKRRLRDMARRRARVRTVTMAVIVSAALFIMAVLIAVVMGRGREKPQYAFINTGRVEQTAHVRGIVVREEYVLPAPAAGLVTPAVRDGYRVDKYGVILKLTDAGMAPVLTQLADLENQILARRLVLQQSGQTDPAVTHIYDLTSRQMETVVRGMRRESGANLLRDMGALQSGADILLADRSRLLGALPASDAELSALAAQKEELSAALDANAQTVTAPESGLVAYSSDGLEDQLNFEAAQVMTSERLNDYLQSERTMAPLSGSVEPSEPVCRVISDFRQYLVLSVTGVRADAFEDPLQKFQVRISDLEVVLDNCLVDRAVDTETGCLLVLRTDDQLEALLDRRKVEGSLILDVRSGIMVPKSAMLLQRPDADVGRIRLLDKGFIREVAVKLLYSDRDAYMIEPLNEDEAVFEGNIVVINPETVKAGDSVG